MESIELKNKSWHFWLSNFCVENEIWSTDTINICEYTRRVLRGILLLSVFSIIGFTFVASTLYSIGNLFSVIFLYGYEIQSVTAFMVVFYSFIGYGLFKHHRENNKRKQPKIAKDPSFLALAYRKFKTKTCFMVKFK